MLALNQLTPEQKIGRVLCARRFNDEDDIAFTLELVKKEAIGCLQIPFNDRTRDLIKLYRDAANYPLLIVNDMEKGLPLSALPKIPLVSLAACNNKEYTEIFAAAIAKEAKELGYSGCWSPIVDIVFCDGPCKMMRCSGSTPKEVTDIARDMLKVFDSYRFHGTAKHYPGGDCGPVDSHMVEGVSEMTEEELLSSSLIPYVTLSNEGILPAIMTGHKLLRNIDPVYPTSLSKKMIDLIRSRGFDGVLYTDSLAMMAILQKFGEAHAMELALMAGNDIILSNYRTPTREVYNMLLNSYREGRITDERLDEAVRRVMVLEQYCSQEPTNPYTLPENLEEVLGNIARDCVTAECDKGVSPAIDPEKKRLFIVLTQQEFTQGAPTEEISSGIWYSPEKIIEAISDRFPGSKIVTMKEYPTSWKNAEVLNDATAFDDVVAVTFCDSEAYTGTDSLTRRVESVLNALSTPGKLKAIVHFGNPLALKPINNVPRKIYGYISPESQVHAIDVLAGRLEAKGKNPFSSLEK